MNPAFKQIGNAVPALLAKAVAHHLYSQLKGRHVAKTRHQEAEGV
jgi:site-specific DNA-cytosine methylase